MIEYYRGAYGWNLLFRVHGSAIYKAMLLGILAVMVYLLIEILREDEPDDLNHPYGIGILVSSVSFLIIFRANYGYQRYWEACGDIHQMMSKWMDATVHTCAFHMQQSHYDCIKPPSYFDHHDLNRYNLTRDRERRSENTSSSSWTEDVPLEESLHKSIEYINDKKKRNMLRRRRDRVGEGNPHTINSPHHLLGPGRPDGGWGMLFTDEPGNNTTTFFSAEWESSILQGDDTHEPRNDGGFASTKGGRTPDLFLQELAHLSSLCCAVALSTLRNDIEGAESPLTAYTPGSPWPEADPDRLPSVTKHKFLPKFILLKNLRYWIGMDRTPEARTKYNASRPLAVLGGVSDNEIVFLQRARGAYAKTMLAWLWLSEFVTREHLAGSTGTVGPPIISRLIQFLSDGMIGYNSARKIMYIPFPFPHAQLSAFFMLVMIPTVPFLMDQYTNETWLGCLLSFLTVTCLAGLHEVARELENPFRNVPNDIPLCTLQAQYNEALITMFAGYHPDHYWSASDYINRPKEAATEASQDGNDNVNKSKNKRDDNEGSPRRSSIDESRSTRLSNGIPTSSIPQSVESAAGSREGKDLFQLQEMILKQAEEIDRLRSMVENKKST